MIKLLFSDDEGTRLAGRFNLGWAGVVADA